MKQDLSGLQLILFRHAKSDWGDESLSDHDRPLNRRGRRDTPQMANWMQQNDLVPDLVLCSTAVRAQETLASLCESWEANSIASPSTIDCPDLYLATAETILNVFERHGGNARQVMSVGHNPGISHLASLLARRAVEMPTAALAAYQFEQSDWTSIRDAQLPTQSHFMKPKALPS